MNGSPSITRSLAARLLDGIGTVGEREGESAEARLSRQLLVFGGVLMSGGGLLWGTISAAYGQLAASSIPFGYIACTAMNLALFHATKRFERARFVQVLLSLVLPFLFQWVLGGFMASGAVMMWALIAIVGSLTFTDAPSSVLWLVLFCILTLVSGAIDTDVSAASSLRTSKGAQVAFFVVNIVVITAIVFGLTIYLTHRRTAATAELGKANDAIRVLNQQLSATVTAREGHIDELRALTSELQVRSSELADAHKELTDSIRYASLIQHAILPSSVGRPSGCEWFVLWMPRDVVGGDLYVQRSFDDGCLFGVVDCAGHGVPGACMTMIAHAALQAALAEASWKDPAATITALDRACRAMFSTTSAAADHADPRGPATSVEVGLCAVDRASGVVRFAGAKVGLLWSDASQNEGECHLIRGGTRSVNGKRAGTYENHEIAIEPGRTFYLTTDGLLDQAGGEHGHALGNRRLAEWLAARVARPMDEQRRSLSEELDRYRGTRALRDDVTLLGFRLVCGAPPPASVPPGAGDEWTPVLERSDTDASQPMAELLHELRARIEATGAPARLASDVFGVAVELVQNVERHAKSQPHGGTMTLLVRRASTGRFGVWVRNTVREPDGRAVEARVASIARMSPAELGAARKAQLRRPRGELVGGGAGVGLFTVAQRVAEPLEATLRTRSDGQLDLELRALVE
jgi:serine phosphatase RsbU (regulator of sigma subunit)